MDTKESMKGRFGIIGIALLALFFLVSTEALAGGGLGEAEDGGSCTDGLDGIDADGLIDCRDFECRILAVCGDEDIDGICSTTDPLPPTATCTLTGGGPGGVDNCRFHINSNQVDTDSDGKGDPCDPDTINPAFTKMAPLNEMAGKVRPVTTHEATTPLYHASVSAFGGFPGLFTNIVFEPTNDGFKEALTGEFDTSYGMEVVPFSMRLGATDLEPHSLTLENNEGAFTQSTWQSLVQDKSFRKASLSEADPGEPIRTHVGSTADSLGIGFEIGDDTAGKRLADLLPPPSGNVLVGFSVTVSHPSASLNPSARAQVNVNPAQFATDPGDPSFIVGTGKITIRTAGGQELIRISEVGCGAFGKATAIVEDSLGALPIPASETGTVTPIDGSPGSTDFYGLSRLIKEIDDSITNILAGDDLGPAPQQVGINHRDGVTANTIKVKQEFHENMADGELGRWFISALDDTLDEAISFNLFAHCPLSFVARNRDISNRMGIGFGLTSLSDSSTTGLADTTIHGKHGVGFSEELNATWNNLTIRMDNTGPNRFDGGTTTNYDLFPNKGGTCRFSDCAQVHTGLAFAGSTVNLTGNATIESVGGGTGVGFGPGGRVALGDLCLGSNPNDITTSIDSRCAVNFNKRGKLTFNKLIVNGAMSGLAASESDVIGGTFIAALGDDPNAVDFNLTHARVGLGMGADKGVRIGWNVLTNEYLSNVPLKPSVGQRFNAITGLLESCTPDLGVGTCFPKPDLDASGSNQPSGTGIANLRVDRVVLTAQTDLVKPTGIGLSCGIRQGSCNVGEVDLVGGACTDVEKGVIPRSVITGFELGLGVGGGTNVDPPTGVGRRHDDSNAVPKFVACLRNMKVTDSETGVSIGTNIDVSMKEMTVDQCQYTCLNFAQHSANVATVANTTAVGAPCPSSDGITCDTIGDDYAAPKTGIGEEDHLAAIAGGITAATVFRAPKMELGCACNPVTGVCLNNSGQEPVLPNLKTCSADADCSVGGSCLLVTGSTGLCFPLTCEDSDPSPTVDNSTLTFYGAQACALNLPAAFLPGPDLILFPIGPDGLLDIQVPVGLICTLSPAMHVHNKYYPPSSSAPPFNIRMPGTCVLDSGTQSCQTQGLVSATVGGATVGPVASLNTSLAAAVATTPPPGVGSDADGDGFTDRDDCAPDDPLRNDQNADTDLDGTVDCVDLCLGTSLVGPIPTVSLRPNHIGDNFLVRGCNCSQILSCKPGENLGEQKFGCTPGTQNVFSQKSGWAASCTF